MLKLNQVCKQYDNGHVAIDQVSFEMQQGEMMFLTGHSGAGKTTILKLILQIEPVTRGQILIQNKNMTRRRFRRYQPFRKNIGIVFQNPQLINQLSVFDNVALPLIVDGWKEKNYRLRAAACLERVGLLDKKHVHPFELSTGEQQRLGIARAIVNEPTLILADEPTGNLDPPLAADIMQLFRDVNRSGTSVLIATHDLTLIASMPHRILSLKNGKMRNSLAVNKSENIVSNKIGIE